MFDYKNEEICLEYARAYILPQKYNNLYSINEALWRGTIFKDLYRPYKKESNCEVIK